MSGGPDAQVHHVDLSAVAPQPWRNGGGQTRELLAWPPGATTWRVRVSVADITADGPFSVFDGVQRWFQVLSGHGVILQTGDVVQRLTPDEAPWSFDGERAPDCRLVNGPTRDLNLMVRRGPGQAALRRVQAGQALRPGPRWRALFTGQPLTWCAGTRARRDLPALSLLWSDTDATRAWSVLTSAPTPTESPLRAWWLTWTPTPGPNLAEAQDP